MNRRTFGAALAALVGAGVLGLATSAAADGTDRTDQGPGYPVVEHPAPGVGLIPRDLGALGGRNGHPPAVAADSLAPWRSSIGTSSPC